MIEPILCHLIGESRVLKLLKVVDIQIHRQPSSRKTKHFFLWSNLDAIEIDILRAFHASGLGHFAYLETVEVRINVQNC